MQWRGVGVLVWPPRRALAGFRLSQVDGRLTPGVDDAVGAVVCGHYGEDDVFFLALDLVHNTGSCPDCWIRD